MSTAQPASRLITLILLLQRRPNQKAAELAAALGVSVRTVHRYFAMLDEMGIPVYTERGPQGGFSLVRGYKMPPLVLSPEEATALYLGAGLVEEIWGGLYHDAVQGALAKLDNVLPDEQRAEAAWARRTLVTFGVRNPAAQTLDPLLKMVRRAIREQVPLSFDYQGGRGGPPEPRQVDPYALAHRSGWGYLVGYCRLRRALRIFRLDRIEAPELTAEKFARPTGFDARAYLAQAWASEPPFQARVQFRPHGAAAARANRAMWTDLAEQPDGSVVVGFAAPDLEWAASTILAFGPLVRVLAPTELQRVVAEWAQAVVEQYSTQT